MSYVSSNNASLHPTTATTRGPVYIPPRLFIVEPNEFEDVRKMLSRERSPQGAAVVFRLDDDVAFNFPHTKALAPTASSARGGWAKFKAFFTKQTVTPSSTPKTGITRETATVLTSSTASVSTSAVVDRTAVTPKTTHIAGPDPFRASMVHHLTAEEQRDGAWLGLAHQLSKGLYAFAAESPAVKTAQCIAEEHVVPSPAETIACGDYAVEGDIQAWIKVVGDACKVLERGSKGQQYSVFADAHEGSSPLVTLFGESAADENITSKVEVEYDDVKAFSEKVTLATVKDEELTHELVIGASPVGATAYKAKSLRSMRPVPKPVEGTATVKNARRSAVSIPSVPYTIQILGRAAPPVRPARSPLRALDPNQVTRTVATGHHTKTATPSNDTQAHFIAAYSVVVKFSPSKSRGDNFNKRHKALNRGDRFPFLV